MSGKEVTQVPGSKTIGPYSQAVRAAGLLFVSGQPGIDPSTGESAGPTFEVQARQTFKNLDTVLRAGSSRLDLVVNTTVLLADISNFAELNTLFTEFFPHDPPARDDHASPAPEGIADIVVSRWSRSKPSAPSLT